MKKRILVCLAVLIAVFNVIKTPSVMASSMDGGATNVTTADNSIVIKFKITDIETYETTYLDGATFTLYKVADLVRNGDVNAGDYKLINEFEMADINFDGMTASESEVAAKELARMGLTSYDSATTDMKGNAVFEELTDGMYLVIETSVSGTSADYSFADPFLVAAPQFNGETWISEIICSPKTVPYELVIPTPPIEEPEIEPEPGPEPNTPPKTGESMDAYIWTGIAACATSALILLVTTRKTRRKEETMNA